MMNQDLIKIQHFLLSWYDGHARSMPWRDVPSPYRTWISEIMLQQTRVDTVIPYFERFVKELPTVQSLAEVDEQQLLKLWEGLGYYHRARNLKKAALEIVEKYHGTLPSTFEELIKLPGIGPYSAGAIASIAFGVRTPAIDGNVLRVFARIAANHGDIMQRDVKKDIEECVLSVMPSARAGDFNQALMELGATVCLPNGEPKCDVCPIITFCCAYNEGIANQLPVKSKMNPRKMEARTVFVMICKGRNAIRKRQEEGLLPGLWELPNVEGALSIQQCKKMLEEWNISPASIEVLQNAKHIFTHIEWHMTGYLVYVDSFRQENTNIQEAVSGEALVWVTPQEMSLSYALPTAFKAYIAKVKELLK